MSCCDWWEEDPEFPGCGRCLLHGDSGEADTVCWLCDDKDEPTEEECQ